MYVQQMNPPIHWRSLIVLTTIIAALLWLTGSNLTPAFEPAAPLINQQSTIAADPISANSHSQTYLVGENQYESVISPITTHYQDSRGEWQAYDPLFRNTGEHFIVNGNTIRSRAGQDRAWVSVGAGEAAIYWKAQTLGVVSADNAFTPIAAAIEESNRQATQAEDGKTLLYNGSWSDERITEALISDRDLLEHVLIINEPLSSMDVSGNPIPETHATTTLEMRATLQLLPGTTLWANGVEQTSAFATDDTLEIRDRYGNVAMIFDPVLAFEQNDRAEQVTGSYLLEPTDDGWLVKVRTPLAWWSAADREYPVVLDPTMRVERTSGGFGKGMAWVGTDPDNGDKPYQGGGIRLGTWYGYGGSFTFDQKINSQYPGWNSQSEGYLQFTVLPGLLENSPMKIKSAELTFAAKVVGGPYYKGSVDWKNKTTQGKIELFDVGACPTDCGGFSLHDDRVTDENAYNWSNRPLGSSMGKQLLTSPAVINSSANPVELNWDVTTQIANWYNTHYDGADRPKPTFRIKLNNPVCGYPGPYTGDFHHFVHGCSMWDIPFESVKLHIEYEPLDLNVYQNLLNEPGIPTYADTILADTYHEYHLQPTAPKRWRAVAVRGDHKFEDPAVPARISLKLTSNFLEGVNQVADDELSHGDYLPKEANQTAVLFVDDQVSQNVVNDTELWARVQPMDDNDWQQDPDRNYRIHYSEATNLVWNEPAGGIPYGQLQTVYYNLPSNQLVSLRDFYAEAQDNVTIFFDAPDGLDAYLLHPSEVNSLTEAVLSPKNKDIVEAIPFDNGSFSFNGEVAKIGRYGIALVNNDRPFPDDERPDYPGQINVAVNIVRCPAYTVWTFKYQACQPIILPPNSPSRQISVPVGGGTKTLTIHSEGGFTSSGADWCTQNELQGTPIIEQAGVSRYIYVAQGSICYQNGELTTSDDAGVGLTVHVANLNNRRRGKHLRFLFGDSGELKPGDKDGETRIFTTQDVNALFSLVAKDDGTWVHVDTVFGRWGDTYVPDGNLGIDLHTVKLGESGLLDMQITTDVAQAPYPRQFVTSWETYPKEVNEFNYGVEPAWGFAVSADQDSPLPLVLTDIEGVELRILNNANQPTGIFDHFDVVESLTALASVDQFRMDRGRLTADASMGGASVDAQFVLMPPGDALQPQGLKDCDDNGTQTTCFDIRRDDYDWNNGKGSVALWKLPDLHIEETAQTMAVNSPGQLSVFSSDHPRAANSSSVDQSFSYDTYGASVSITLEPCVNPSDPVVTVIKGEASMMMPNVSDEGGAGFKIAFKICETALAQVYFEASFEPTGIVVGSTGVKLQFISMNVLIDPNAGYAVITFTLKFDSVDGQTMQDFTGEITIDTRGLFEIEASGKFFAGMLDPVQFRLAVAWNPFDMLFEGSAQCCDGGNLISGGIYLHAWVGQGWQNKYHWLPNNSDFHFTGSIWAQINIESGMVVDEFPFILPPFDFSLKITISFGEFCTNASCTQYEWGISGVLEVMGYGVGLYISESGVDLILGSNDHILIDQYSGGSRANGSTRQLQALPQPVTPGNQQPYLINKMGSSVDDWTTTPWADKCTNQGGGVHTCTFDVSQGSGRAIFVTSWQNGTLSGQLTAPDNTVITPQNADQFGGVYSTTVNSNVRQFSFAFAAPADSAIQDGTWTLQLSGVVEQPDPFPSNYNLMFATDPPKPSVEWVNLVGQVSADSAGNITLQWNATQGGQPVDPALRMSIFIAPLAEKPITPTMVTGTPVAVAVPANAGSQVVNLGAFGSGEYAVGLEIDDHLSGNGAVVVWADGSILYNDTTPPPVPTILGSGYLQDGRLKVRWTCDDTTVDLGGYLVEYTIPNIDPNAQPLQEDKRVSADCLRFQFGQIPFPLWETTSIVGLSNSQLAASIFETEVCVRSYDASFNVSDCVPFNIRLVDDREERLSPPEPVIAEQSTDNIDDAFVYWDVPRDGEPDGYIVSYTPIGCLIPGYDPLLDPPTPAITDADTFFYHFERMTMWQTYRFEVRAFTESGQISPPNFDDVRMIDTRDEDGDGLWDGWADLYGVQNAGEDPDKDGLTNGHEQQLGTNPMHADSDGDGFYDGEENGWETDPCNHNDKPPYHDRSKLVVAGHAKPTLVVPVNTLSVQPAKYTIWNGGAGELNWSSQSRQRWMVVNQTENGFEISINPSLSYSVGVYEGEVVITNQPTGRAEYVEEVVIPVTLEIIPAQDAVPTAVGISGQTAASSGLWTVWVFVLLFVLTLGKAIWSKQS